MSLSSHSAPRNAKINDPARRVGMAHIQGTISQAGERNPCSLRVRLYVYHRTKVAQKPVPHFTIRVAMATKGAELGMLASQPEPEGQVITRLPFWVMITLPLVEKSHDPRTGIILRNQGRLLHGRVYLTMFERPKVWLSATRKMCIVLPCNFGREVTSPA
jgi:hypothetical protein